MRRPRHTPLWTALLLLVVAGGWRLAILFGTGFAVDGDESTLGLMAMHIAQLREAPVWFYGQPYMGSFEAYLVALPMAVFGATAVTLKLTGLTAALATVLLGWLLVRRTLGPVAGLVAGLYLAVPPMVLSMWSMKTSGGRMLLYPLGIAMLLSAQAIGARGATRRNTVVLGLLVGLATWLNLLLFPFIGAACLLLLSRREVVTRPRLIGWFLAACVVGASPLIIDNILSGAETFLFVWNRPGGARTDVSNMFLLHPFQLLGIIPPWSKAGDVPAWGMPTLLAFLAGAAFVIWRGRGRPATGAVLLVWVPVIFFTGALIMSGYGSRPSPRFVSVVYPSIAAVIGALAAAGWEGRGRAARTLTAAGVLLLLGFNVHSLWPHLGQSGGVFLGDPNGILRQERGSAESCLALLRDEGVDGLAGPHWQRHVLNFMSGDQIVPSGARYPAHAERFRQARQIAWATSGNDPDQPYVTPILDDLAQAGVVADELESHGMRLVFLRDTGHASADWSADSNSSPTKAERAIDRDPRTGWSAFERPLDAVEPPALTVDFGRALRIGRLGFAFASLYGPPRRLGVRMSLDGETWTPFVILAPEGLVWSTRMDPEMARYVQLQAMSGDDMRWQLKELFSFPP